MPCDNFFENEGIPYNEDWADRAVRAVLSADFYDPPRKKWLITCWFDETYGQWESLTFDRTNSTDAMKAFLANSKYATFEDMISGGKTNG